MKKPLSATHHTSNPHNPTTTHALYVHRRLPLPFALPLILLPILLPLPFSLLVRGCILLLPTLFLLLLSKWILSIKLYLFYQRSCKHPTTTPKFVLHDNDLCPLHQIPKTSTDHDHSTILHRDILWFEHNHIVFVGHDNSEPDYSFIRVRKLVPHTAVPYSSYNLGNHNNFVSFNNNSKNDSLFTLFGINIVYRVLKKYNDIRMPVPTFFTLLLQNMLSPFFVFQIFTSLLWCLDEYPYHALFTVFMLVVFEMGVVFTRLKSLQEFGSVRNEEVRVKLVCRPNEDVVVNDGDGYVSSMYVFPGDVVVIDKAVTVPCDMIVLEGSCAVNEAMLTGESVPQMKEDIGMRERDEVFVECKDKRHVLYGGTDIVKINENEGHVLRDFLYKENTCNNEKDILDQDSIKDNKSVSKDIKDLHEESAFNKRNENKDTKDNKSVSKDVKDLHEESAFNKRNRNNDIKDNKSVSKDVKDLHEESAFNKRNRNNDIKDNKSVSKDVKDLHEESAFNKRNRNNDIKDNKSVSKDVKDLHEESVFNKRNGHKDIKDLHLRSKLRNKDSIREILDKENKNYLVCYILKTGFDTQKGDLVNKMLLSEQMTINNREAFLFIGCLLVFAIIASGYVIYDWMTTNNISILYYLFNLLKNIKSSKIIKILIERIKILENIFDYIENRNSKIYHLNKEKTYKPFHKLILEVVLILTNVVPPELPMEMTLAVNSALQSLLSMNIFCLEAFRIPVCGKVSVCCFDKTGTLTESVIVCRSILLPEDLIENNEENRKVEDNKNNEKCSSNKISVNSEKNRKVDDNKNNEKCISNKNSENGEKNRKDDSKSNYIKKDINSKDDIKSNYTKKDINSKDDSKSNYIKKDINSKDDIKRKYTKKDNNRNKNFDIKDDIKRKYTKKDNNRNKNFDIKEDSKSNNIKDTKKNIFKNNNFKEDSKSNNIKESNETMVPRKKIGLNKNAILNPEDLMKICMSTCHSLIKTTTLVGDPVELSAYNFLTINYINDSSSSFKNIQTTTLKKFAFTSEARRMTIIGTYTENSKKDNYFVATKGAPEVIKRLLENIPQNYDVYMKYASQGMRIIAVAYKKINSNFVGMTQSQVEDKLEFVGFLVYECAVKDGSRECIVTLRESGCDVVMITGDNLLTAMCVAEKVGIIEQQNECEVRDNKNNDCEGRDNKNNDCNECEGRDNENNDCAECEGRDNKNNDCNECEVRDNKNNDCEGRDNKNNDCNECEGRDNENNDCNECEGRDNKNNDCNECEGRDNKNNDCNECEGRDNKNNDCNECEGRDNKNNDCNECEGRDNKNNDCNECEGRDNKNNDCNECEGRDNKNNDCNECEGRDNKNNDCNERNNANCCKISNSKLGVEGDDIDESLNNPSFKNIKVFARADPLHKEKIIEKYKSMGHTVLMCGDGTNDVGALKKADVGVALVPPKKKKKKNEMGEYKCQIGDASIAAPFTTKSLSITPILDIIRQGRSTLVTTIQMYKILGLNSLISAYSLSVLDIMGIRYGDVQMIVSGILIAFAFMFLTRSRVIKTISKNKPPSKIFSMYFIISVIIQTVIHIFAFIVVVKMVRINVEYEVEGFGMKSGLMADEYKNTMPQIYYKTNKDGNNSKDDKGKCNNSKDDKGKSNSKVRNIKDDKGNNSKGDNNNSKDDKGKSNSKVSNIKDDKGNNNKGSNNSKDDKGEDNMPDINNKGEDNKNSSDYDKKFRPSLLNSLIFILSVSQQINTFTINYIGRPFRESLLENTHLRNSLGAVSLILIAIIFELYSKFSRFMEIVPLEFDMKIKIFTVVMIDFLGCWAAERFALWMFSVE